MGSRERATRHTDDPAVIVRQVLDLHAQGLDERDLDRIITSAAHSRTTPWQLAKAFYDAGRGAA